MYTWQFTYRIRSTWCVRAECAAPCSAAAAALLTCPAPWSASCSLMQGDEQAEKIVPALTGVFAEALKGGVSNLSFGDLSGQLGGWQDGRFVLAGRSEFSPRSSIPGWRSASSLKTKLP